MSIFGNKSSDEQVVKGGEVVENEVLVTGEVGTPAPEGIPEAEVDIIDEEKLNVIGHTEDGTPVVTRGSMVEQLGEEAIQKAEDEAEVLDEAPAVVLENEEEVIVAGKKVISHDGHIDAMGRFIEEDHYEDGTGQVVAIDGVKVN